MRYIYSLISFLIPVVCFGQPPGYYTSANGLNGQSLRIALSAIIRPHTVLTYAPGLWNAYYTTDKKADGKLWDIYSDIPGGTPAYEYTLGTNQCSGSSPTAEGGCYNREHTWPQSKFGSTAPMQTDLFLVYPTDYYVNSNRGDLPYGKVGTPTKTFTNGSKIGNNTYPGAPAGSCYEPLDSFKGDLARTYFYISTCYRNDSAAFIAWEMASQVNLTSWTVQMLLEWHHNDPVSRKEIDRNNAAYVLQGNRNPFIDQPEYADCIWGTGDCTSLKAASIRYSQAGIRITPNPATDQVSVEWPQYVSSDCAIKMYNTNGQLFYSVAVQDVAAHNTVIPVSGLPKGLYFVQVVTNGFAEVQKLVVQ